MHKIAEKAYHMCGQQLIMFWVSILQAVVGIRPFHQYPRSVSVTKLPFNLAHPGLSTVNFNQGIYIQVYFTMFTGYLLQSSRSQKIFTQQIIDGITRQ